MSFQRPNGLGELGQLGDTFGLLNALFTGLAFTGLLYTAYLQYLQLKAQEKEIHDAANVDTHRQFFELVRFLNEERESRKMIYDAHAGHCEWNDPALMEAGAMVCGQFNIAGVLAKQNPRLKELIVENYGRTAITLHELLSKQREEFLKERGSDYCKEFDWLVEQMKESASQKH
jgi:hypothetical protein